VILVVVVVVVVVLFEDYDIDDVTLE